MIAAGLKIGISKRELLEDYYPDELPLIFESYAELSNPKERVDLVYADEWH